MSPAAPSPQFPPGSTYAVPEARRGETFAPAASTPYDRLPRTLRWAWWRPLLALGVGLAVCVLGSMLVVGGGMLAMYLAGELTSEADVDALLERMLTLDATDTFVLAISLGSIAIWLVAVPIALRVAGMRPKGHISSVALRLRWSWMGLCALVAVLALVVNFGLSLGLGAVVGDAVSPEWTPWSRLWLPLLVVLLLVPFQAAAEEYVFRGFLVQALGSWLPRGIWPRVVVVVVPSLAFVFSHGYGLWGLLDVGVFAATAMWLTLRTGGLEAAIALHVVNNVVVFGILASGALGTTVNGASEGSLAGLLITAISSIGFAWAVESLARRRGIARYSTWPQRETAAPLAIVLPSPVASWQGGELMGTSTRVANTQNA